MKCYDKFLDGLIAIAAVIALAVCLCHQAKSEPVPTTEWVYQGLAAVDMLQTLDISKHKPVCDQAGCTPGIQESNPILGPYPSNGKVVGYFAVTGVLHFLLTKELVNGHVPGLLVQGWECATIGLEAYAIGHNYHIGLRVQF
jgi:hypothetical protein